MGKVTKIVLSDRDRLFLEKSKKKMFSKAQDFGYGQNRVYAPSASLSQLRNTQNDNAVRSGPRRPQLAGEVVDLSSAVVGDERILGPALDLLLSGMKKGSKIDKEAAQQLLAAVKNKRISANFHNCCVRKYNDALMDYERSIPFVSVVSRVTSNISNIIEDGAEAVRNLGKDVGKVTQRILFDLPRQSPVTE